jgi:uncharacterized protein
MKKIFRVVSLLLLMSFFFINIEQIAAQSVVKYIPVKGIWRGLLQVTPKDSLAMVLVVDTVGDSVKVVLDSPDQYVTDIPVSSFSFVGDSVSFKVTSLYVTYTGILYPDENVIKGTFTQGRKKLPLSLSKTNKRILANRPQTPVPPFNYVVEPDIVINDPKTGMPLIMGTLTYPENKKPKGTVIMISGSGWQDRDETILSHKPFFVIADYLTRRGYAVFRYDDVPKYKFAKSTTFDFADNVNLIIDSLKSYNKFDLGKIGLLGHSEGGLVAFIVAAQNPDIKFVISMAGVGETMKETLLYQARVVLPKQNYTSEELEASIKNSEKVYTLVEKSRDVESASDDLNSELAEYTRNMTDSQKVRYNSTSEDLLMLKQQLLSPWLYQVLKIQPGQYIKKIKCPVYALNGEYDLQVGYRNNLSLIEQYLRENPCNTIEMFPKLNHLFQVAETGYYDEYGKIEQTISPEVLDKIGEWLDKALMCE